MTPTELKQQCDRLMELEAAPLPVSIADHIKKRDLAANLAPELIRRVRELEQELAIFRAAKKRLAESYSLEWSDRGGVWHPDELWEAVMACSLDHSDDRTSNGVPYGFPDKWEDAFAEVVERHLAAVKPNWKNETVCLDERERAAFESELKKLNARLCVPSPPTFLLPDQTYTAPTVPTETQSQSSKTGDAR